MTESEATETQARVDQALRLFDQGLSCAEVVALVGMQQLGRSSELIPRVATGFAGGLSRTGSLCGAVSGAVLVLGAAHGRDRLGDDRGRILSEVQQLVHGFRSRFGSDNCFELTGLDFNQPGGLEEYKRRVHATCRTYVAFVMGELGRMLAV